MIRQLQTLLLSAGFLLGTFALAQPTYSSISMPSGLPTTMGAGSISTTRVVSADFDGDGDTDLLAQTGGTGTQVSYHLNNGNGTFTITSGTAANPSVFSAGPFNGLSFVDIQNSKQIPADYDNDGDMDIFETSTSASRYLQNNSNSFTSITLPANFPASFSTGFARFMTMDFNNDGDVDFIHQQGSNGVGITYCDNDGSGNFTAIAANGSGTFSSGPLNGMTFTNILPTAAYFGDFDNDNDTDIYHWSVAAITYYRNDNGTWSNPGIPSGLPTSLAVGKILTADFDADGDVDMLYQNSATTGTNINLCTNNGSGTFSNLAAGSPSGTFSGGIFNGLTFDDIFATRIFPLDHDVDGDLDLFYMPNTGTTATFLSTNSSGPLVTNKTPVNLATGVSTSTSLSITASENITAGTSNNNIYIRRFSDNVAVQTIASNSGSVSGSGTTTVTITLSALSAGTQYYVTMDDGAFKDASGIILGNFAKTIKDKRGFTDKAYWSFTTAAALPEINVQGNSNTIVDGDVSPSATDHTDFGSQGVCSGTIVRTFTIQNTGSSNLTLSNPVVSGTHAADFTVTANPSTPVSAAGSTTFQVTFNPSAEGIRSATITISNNDADEGTYDFAIQGTGQDPEVNVQGNGNTIVDGDATPSVTDHTDFGSQDMCTGTIVRTFTIQNTGNSNLNLANPTLSGTHAADFSVTTTPSTPVSAAGSTTFQVTFNPSASGTRTATISFTNDDCDEATYDFAIQGTGTDGTPNADDPSDVTACDTYELPVLGVGNYFTGSGGTGTALNAGDDITSSQTVYVYAVNGSCSDENSFMITINNAPAITSHPSNASNICTDYNVSFSVTATGATGYQWEVSTNGGGNWNTISNTGIYSGATTATLSLTDVSVADNNNQYLCIVSGACAPTATSNAATLTVNAPVNIPTGLSTTAVGLTTATVNWGTVSGSNMRVALRKVGTTSWHIKDAAYADSYVLTGDFSTDVNYEWKVKVQDGGCWGDWSAIETFYICETPAAPTALMSSNVFINKATLSWTSPGAEEMRIGLKRQGTTVWYYENSSYADSFVYHGNFSKNATYDWRIKIRCGTEWGDWSSMAQFTTGTVSGMIVNNSNPGTLAEDMFVEDYPNPNNGEFTIQSSHEGTFNIVNELGQVVQTMEFTKENNFKVQIGMKHASYPLQQGIYFLTGTINDEVITKKIMVIK